MVLRRSCSVMMERLDNFLVAAEMARLMKISAEPLGMPRARASIFNSCLIVAVLNLGMAKRS